MRRPAGPRRLTPRRARQGPRPHLQVAQGGRAQACGAERDLLSPDQCGVAPTLPVGSSWAREEVRRLAHSTAPGAGA